VIEVVVECWSELADVPGRNVNVVELDIVHEVTEAVKVVHEQRPLIEGFKIFNINFRRATLDCLIQDSLQVLVAQIRRLQHQVYRKHECMSFAVWLQSLLAHALQHKVCFSLQRTDLFTGEMVFGLVYVGEVSQFAVEMADVIGEDVEVGHSVHHHPRFFERVLLLVFGFLPNDIQHLLGQNIRLERLHQLSSLSVIAHLNFLEIFQGVSRLQNLCSK
jgi:hypothetical protein